jgi:hypothetical protein
MTGRSTTTASSNVTYNWGIQGLVMDPHKGPKPERTPEHLLSTRAVESAAGWLGQIVMGGVIVYETKPQQSSAKALLKVNRRIHNRIKRLIVGA